MADYQRLAGHWNDAPFMDSKQRYSSRHLQTNRRRTVFSILDRGWSPLADDIPWDLYLSWRGRLGYALLWTALISFRYGIGSDDVRRLGMSPGADSPASFAALFQVGPVGRVFVLIVAT